MHRSLAGWLVAHPWQAAFAAALFGVLSLQGAVLLVVLASAVPVLMVLERGLQVGMNVAFAGCAAVIGMLVWFQQPLWVAVVYAIVLFIAPLLLGLLLERTRSLNLVFQMSLAAALLLIAVMFAVLPAPTELWERLLTQVFSALQASGLQMDAALAGQLARTMWGAFLSVIVLFILCGVFMARWWQSLLHQPGAFGQEFRALTCGNALGAVMVLIAAVAVIAELDWADSMAWIAVLGLALQGLAAAHRRKASGQLRRGWLVAIYVFLIVPLFSFITVALLAGWGLADFWRQRLAAR